MTYVDFNSLRVVMERGIRYDLWQLTP